jgi:aminoglycoside phosphotransferase (APT) family kinase protein
VTHPNQRTLASLPPELRRTTVPDDVRAWIDKAAGSPVVRTRRLPGASSTAVHGVWLANGRRVVLRRYVWPGYIEAEPAAARREVDALRFAAGHGLPVPLVIAADVDGDVPALLMSFLPGRAEATPDLARLAEVAATIHATPAEGYGHHYYRWYSTSHPVPPADSKRKALWEKAIRIWLDEMPSYQPAFIHRDFHPGNVLWSRGRATGIVDWANACQGPPGCDIAHCRTNLVNLDGQAAADRFTKAYEAATGTTFDPYWQIASLMEHDVSKWAASQLAGHEDRLASALRAYDGR